MSAPTKIDLTRARDALMAAKDRLIHANRTHAGKSAAMGDYNRARAKFDNVCASIRAGRWIHSSREYADFDTTVQGIPCGVVIERVVGGYPGSLYEPPEPYEAEVHLLDSKGYPALWLERKCTPDDWGRIEIEALACAKEQEDDAKIERYLSDKECA